MNKLIISKREATKLLGCSSPKLNTLINKGFIKIFVDIPNGFSPRIPITSINAYIEQNTFSMPELINHTTNGQK